jgi:hypothetical protein
MQEKSSEFTKTHGAWRWTILAPFHNHETLVTWFMECKQETGMSKSMNSFVTTVGLWSLALALVPLQAQTDGAPKVLTPRGDLAMELVGQVMNVPMTTTSIQYGYLSLVDGIDAVFTSSPHNEKTARFSFNTEATTTQVINNGNLRIVDRVGATTIYLDGVPNGDFAVPSTFADGMPVLTMSLKQQVILDLVENTFTTVNFNRVTSVSAFEMDGQQLRLGQVGDQFRTSISGRGNSTGTIADFVIAGYTVPIAAATPR